MSQIRLPWQRHKILLSNEPVMLGFFHRFSDNRTSCRCRLLVGLADLATSGWLQRSVQRIFSRRLAQIAAKCYRMPTPHRTFRSVFVHHRYSEVLWNPPNIKSEISINERIERNNLKLCRPQLSVQKILPILNERFCSPDFTTRCSCDFCLMRFWWLLMGYENTKSGLRPHFQRVLTKVASVLFWVLVDGYTDFYFKLCRAANKIFCLLIFIIRCWGCHGLAMQHKWT